MFIRRMIVFSRSTREWYLMLSPFITVLTIYLVLMCLFKIVLDRRGKESTTADGSFDLVIAALFPFFLNVAYTTASGAFLMLPIEEREMKMKHIMTMSGMRIFSYWSGLFLADFCLFLIPTFAFSCLILAIGMDGYYDEFLIFLIVLCGFGFSLIAFTYIISLVFTKAD